MFAVKGWSLDAATLKPQISIPRPAKSKDDSEDKPSKKRKRKGGKGGVEYTKQDPNVRPDDVGRLWEQHVEGKGPSKSQKQREHKKAKVEHMREGHVSSRVSPNTASKSKGGQKIERREHIIPGTRAEQRGVVQGKKKRRVEHEQSVQERPNKEESKDVPKDDVADDAESENDDDDSSLAASSDDGRDDMPAMQNGSHQPLPQPTTLTPMQAAMRQKLTSARFRHLNETLYTTPSTKAQALFDQDPAMFADYHAGFRQQVAVWPENPLDKFIVAIRRRAKIKPPPPYKPKKRKVNAKAKPPPKENPEALPRTDGLTVIADLGCGDARLASTLTVSGEVERLKLRLHSFDLSSASPLVTKADIAKLPLRDHSVDVAILCLALMGTNWIDFIEEAFRVLRWKGELWVAEIKSRFARSPKGQNKAKSGVPVSHSVGNKRKLLAQAKTQAVEDEATEQETLAKEVDGVQPTAPEDVAGATDVSAFIDVLKRRGFILKPRHEASEFKSLDLTNKMFVKMEFVKALDPSKGKYVPETAKDGKSGISKGFKPGASGPRKWKYVRNDDEEGVLTDDEKATLKPCLYKVR